MCATRCPKRCACCGSARPARERGPRSFRIRNPWRARALPFRRDFASGTIDGGNHASKRRDDGGVELATPSQTIRQAALLMEKNDCGVLPVADKDSLVG